MSGVIDAGGLSVKWGLQGREVSEYQCIRQRHYFNEAKLWLKLVHALNGHRGSGCSSVGREVLSRAISESQRRCMRERLQKQDEVEMRAEREDRLGCCRVTLTPLLPLECLASRHTPQGPEVRVQSRIMVTPSPRDLLKLVVQPGL